jgi:hypothetical protein
MQHHWVGATSANHCVQEGYRAKLGSVSRFREAREGLDNIVQLIPRLVAACVSLRSRKTPTTPPPHHPTMNLSWSALPTLLKLRPTISRLSLYPFWAMGHARREQDETTRTRRSEWSKTRTSLSILAAGVDDVGSTGSRVSNTPKNVDMSQGVCIYRSRPSGGAVVEV